MRRLPHRGALGTGGRNGRRRARRFPRSFLRPPSNEPRPLAPPTNVPGPSPALVPKNVLGIGARRNHSCVASGLRVNRTFGIEWNHSHRGRLLHQTGASNTGLNGESNMIRVGTKLIAALALTSAAVMMVPAAAVAKDGSAT